MMSLEEDLQQKKPFASMEQKTMVNIFYTHSWIMNEMKTFLKSYDITIQQYNILRILKGAQKPISTSIIRERMIDKMSDTTRLISRMIKKSLVSKITCNHDKRLVDIQITEIGIGVMERVNQDIHQIENKLEALSNDEHVSLNTLLDRLRK
jgi:DNA-binding MarR family transcriptional regulator